MNLDLQNYEKKRKERKENSQNVNKNILSFLNWSGEDKQTMF